MCHHRTRHVTHVFGQQTGKLAKRVSLLAEEVACTVCQKTFKRKDYLKQHMKTHAPERDVYRCPREGCARTYTTVFNLQSHILSFHEEKRPFVCEHTGCGKTFAMKVSVSHSRPVCSCSACRSSRLTRPVLTYWKCCTAGSHSDPTEPGALGLGG